MPCKSNILLVDDKPERLLTYEVILERLNQNLVCALSGEEAYERLKENEFAAILLDVNMPGIDGFETAALIRSDPRIGKTPIIFVTGVHISDRDRLHGYEMGAADYVYVPVIPEILRSKIDVLVQLDLQRRELAELNVRLADMNRELAEAHARSQAENVRKLQRLNSTLERANSKLVSEVSDRKRAESLLIEAARRKDEFISVLGHELRNPLAAIQGGVDLLHASPPDQLDLPWTRNLLQRQLRHLKRLIDELLDVSRIKTGRVQLRREPLDLREVLQHSIDAMKSLIDERNHALTVENLSVPLYVNGDSMRLTQVFCNLIANAAKFTQPGGSIDLSADIRDGTSQSVTICIRDNGPGIAEHMLEQVFDLFTQANNDDARNRSGLGIGLALVRALVELHDGNVRAKSEGPCRGSEFFVTLPLVKCPIPVSAAPKRAACSEFGSPVRLLVVDDNIDMTAGLKMYFERLGTFQVRVESNGRDGIAATLEFKPHLVLLDIGLPDLDGYAVARELRRRAEFRTLPLIALSGFGSERDQERARTAGFNRFLVKPVEMNALLALLKEDLSSVPEQAIN